MTTPTTTKPLSIGTPSVMIESQWMLLDSQFWPDLPDAQIQNRDAMKGPDKILQKKSKIFRLPYLTKFWSSSKRDDGFDIEEKQKYAFDGFSISEELPSEVILIYLLWGFRLGLEPLSLMVQIEIHWFLLSLPRYFKLMCLMLSFASQSIFSLSWLPIRLRVWIPLLHYLRPRELANLWS